MQTPKSFAQTYQEILDKRSFELLEQFRDAKAWKNMTLHDRELLATLFVVQGEMHFEQEDRRVLESFDMARQIAPHSAKVLFQQASVFASQKTHNAASLQLACQSLENATALDPQFFLAWYFWGTVLVNLGAFHEDITYLEEAESKFRKAFTLAPDGIDEKWGEFYWNWGLCWYLLGKQSGEALDFKEAVSRFQQADTWGLKLPAFWTDYGNALRDLGILLGSSELFHQALDWFKLVIKDDPNQAKGWNSMASCYSELFHLKIDEDYLPQSHECFTQAALLSENDVQLWLKWGQLLLHSGRLLDRLDLVQDSVGKFESAHMCDSQNAKVLACWGEAHMVLGAYNERLDLLYDAVNKFTKALSLAPEDAEIWYKHGCCLGELGRYFHDANYYENACEKFQRSLAINSDDFRVWHALGFCLFTVGEMRDDAIVLEKALQHYASMEELYVSAPPHFWNEWGFIYMKLAEVHQEKHYIQSAAEKFEHAIRASGEVQDVEFLYNYGCALDFLGDFEDNEEYYERSVQVLSQVLLYDSTHEQVHYNLGLAYSHLGEVTGDVDHLQKALVHFQIAASIDIEDDSVWNEWGLTLLNLAQLIEEGSHPKSTHHLYKEAEEKLVHSIALGSRLAFYNLCCLHSLNGNYALAMNFLERAEICGTLPDNEEIVEDEWLEGLRSTPAFHKFLKQRKNK